MLLVISKETVPDTPEAVSEAGGETATVDPENGEDKLVEDDDKATMEKMKKNQKADGEGAFVTPPPTPEPGSECELHRTLG